MGALTTALTLASMAVQGVGQIQRGRAEARAARQNRRFAEMEAQDVLARSNEDVAAYQRELRQVTGQQRVALGAQGIDVTQGTATEIARQTAAIGEMDVATIRRNAQRQAWGIRTQADINYRAGMAQAQATGMQAAGTLLQAAGTGWDIYRRRTPASPQARIPAGTTVMRNPLSLPPGAV